MNRREFIVAMPGVVVATGVAASEPQAASQEWTDEEYERSHGYSRAKFKRWLCAGMPGEIRDGRFYMRMDAPPICQNSPRLPGEAPCAGCGK